MSFVDTRTVILLAGVMAALMSLVLYFMRRSYPSSIEGLGAWAASPFVLFLSALLGGLYGKLPNLLTIALPNVLLFVGVYLAYLGSQRFLGVPTAVRRWSALIALTVPFALWFTLAAPDYRTRLMLLSLPLGLLFALHARLIATRAPKSFASWLATITLVGATLIQILRFVTAWANPEDTGVFDPSSPQAIYLSAYIFVILLLTVSLVLMATERLRTEFENLAAHDSLTDAYTRRHMNEACQQELERSRRHGHVMALLLMDLDHFKAINDTYGHQQGDQVLIDFVAQVKALLRRPDQLGRFGGEEFMLMLPETPLEEALSVAERIRSMVGQARETPHCTVSIGVTTNRLDNDSLDTLLARADKALYRAKELGRNRIESA